MLQVLCCLPQGLATCTLQLVRNAVLGSPAHPTILSQICVFF